MALMVGGVLGPFKPSGVFHFWQLFWEVPREECLSLRMDTDFLLGFRFV